MSINILRPYLMLKVVASNAEITIEVTDTGFPN